MSLEQSHSFSMETVDIFLAKYSADDVFDYCVYELPPGAGTSVTTYC